MLKKIWAKISGGQSEKTKKMGKTKKKYTL